jgi:hypothetical protein
MAKGHAVLIEGHSIWYPKLLSMAAIVVISRVAIVSRKPM